MSQGPAVTVVSNNTLVLRPVVVDAVPAWAKRVLDWRDGVANSMPPSIRIPQKVLRDAVQKAADDQGVMPDQVLSGSKLPKAVAARWAAMKALYEMGYSKCEIGRKFGRDHTSVMHALRRISASTSQEQA